jgi:hypothetical protein
VRDGRRLLCAAICLTRWRIWAYAREVDLLRAPEVFITVAETGSMTAAGAT